MAMEHPDEHERAHHHSQGPQSFSLSLDDALYCEEERWGGEVDDVLEACEISSDDAVDFHTRSDTINNNNKNPSSSLLHPSLVLLEQDLFWDDKELISLFAKEREAHLASTPNFETDPALGAARGEAVDWILKVNAYYGFSNLTAILAINYLHRFLSSLHFQKDKPWMIHLASVTCLSLAAKVEETQVPLLLDLQVVVEEFEYVFEAKNIQKMELLVLSTLKWRMNPVTPISFLDHIIRRLGLKNHLQWEFLRRCQSLLVSVVADSRFVHFLPSVLATATMLHVIHQVEPNNAIDYQNQLLGVLKISKEKVNDCYELISELLSDTATVRGENNSCKKRKYYDPFRSSSSSSSPGGVVDAAAALIFNCNSSNDSWSVESSISSPKPSLIKKMRTQEQQMRLPSLSGSRVFMELVSSPR